MSTLVRGIDLEFAALGARPVRYAAAPMLALDLQISAPSGREVYMIALTIQLMIEPGPQRATTTRPASGWSSCSAPRSAGR